MSGSYADLRVWKPAMELVYSIYETTRTFPKDELYQADAARLGEHCKEIGRMLHGFIDFAAPPQN